MPTLEIEEFAKTLVQQVRDAAMRNCDALLQPQAGSPVARRWKGLAAGSSDLRTVVPDAVDEAVFGILQAIDQGLLRLKYVSSSGREVDLAEEGQGNCQAGTWAAGVGGRSTRPNVSSTTSAISEGGDASVLWGRAWLSGLQRLVSMCQGLRYTCDAEAHTWWFGGVGSLR